MYVCAVTYAASVREVEGLQYALAEFLDAQGAATVVVQQVEEFPRQLLGAM